MRRLLLAMIVAVAVCAGGQGKGKGKRDRGPAVGFGVENTRVIQQYYGANPVALPPGLAKKLARGKPLPPGWQKKLRPFPSGLVLVQEPQCGGCGWGVMDGYGVLYDRKTAIILDVIQLASDILR